MVFLSAFTTKTAVYVLLRGFPGTELLIYLGLFMVFYGIVYAILENDMRRILAYSIVNQVGFMVTGIGIGTEMALNGAAAHAFAHIIYKALLLMSAGSVLYMTGKRKCTDLGGLFRTMPITTDLRHRRRPVDLGVSADVRLRLQVDDLGSRGHRSISRSSGTCSPRPRPASSCMPASSSPGSSSSRRIPGLRPPDPPWNMRAAMLLFAALCIGLGRRTRAALRDAAVQVDFVPYTGSHVVFQLQLLLFSGLAFFLMLGWLQRTLTITLDVDWLYRRLGVVVLRQFDRWVQASWNGFAGAAARSARIVVDWTYRHHGADGIMARTWPTGLMAFWTTIVLAAYLVLSYL